MLANLVHYVVDDGYKTVYPALVLEKVGDTVGGEVATLIVFYPSKNEIVHAVSKGDYNTPNSYVEPDVKQVDIAYDDTGKTATGTFHKV